MKKKKQKPGEISASCHAPAVSLKLFKFLHRILLPLFFTADRSFEPDCHSAIRSTCTWLHTSPRWANIHAARPCSPFCLGKQTGHRRDNPIVPCYVPHGLVLSGFADGGLSDVLPPDLFTWQQTRGFMLQLPRATHFQSNDRPFHRTGHSAARVRYFFFVFVKQIKIACCRIFAPAPNTFYQNIF